jgi:hypothetical protein
MGADQHRAGPAEQRFGVGKDADDVGATLDPLVQPIQRIGRQRRPVGPLTGGQTLVPQLGEKAGRCSLEVRVGRFLSDDPSSAEVAHR